MRLKANALVLLLVLVSFSVALAEWSGATGDMPIDDPVTASVDSLLFEDFNGTEGPFANNPLPGWTVIDSGVPEWDETSWSLYDPPSNYEPYWNGNLARVSFAGDDAIADWLISPVIDCSNESAVTFSFKHRHSNSSSNPDIASVFGSTDGGLNWDYTIFETTSSMGEYTHPDTQTIDISSWAVGSDNVKIAFCLQGSYVLTWHIDEPAIEGDVTGTLLYEDFNGPWGPFGNNPPAGWTIINEVVPDPPNANDWSRWYYSTWPDTVALAYDNYNSQTANEWLISPTLSFSETAICSLSFYNSYWDDSYDDTDAAAIWGSTDGGQTWDHLIVAYSGFDDRSTIKAESWRGFDISSWAQNQSNVKIGLHYVKDDPSYLGWWFIDDLLISEIQLLEDNVAVISIDFPDEFIVVGEDYNSQATFQNLGTQQQTFDANLVITDPDEMEVYNTVISGIVVEPLELIQVTFTTPFTPESEGDFTFTACAVNPDDQDPADDCISTVIPAYEHQGSGGPDDFGYVFKDNTVSGGPTFEWIDISETGTQIEPTLHYFMSDELPLGFNFPFYGNTYTSMWVNSHGSVHVGVRSSWLMANDCPVPDPTTPNAPMMMVMWDRLEVQYEIGQGVYYQYFDEDIDYMVVQWVVSTYDEDNTLEFEVVFYEDGDILYQYNDMSEDLPNGQGQEATIGLEFDIVPDLYGMSYLCDDDNPGNRLVDGLAIRWTLGEDGYAYLPGDCNMALGLWPPTVIGGDVTFLVGYFIGGGQLPCNLDGFWASADISGDCQIIGGDVSALVGYLIGTNPEILYCPDYEPLWPPVPDEEPLGWPNCDVIEINGKIISTGSVK